MTAKSLRIDDDDLVDVLVDLERSFGIKFPQDLRHVHTVGDLHQALLSEVGTERVGDFCGTSRIFYALRSLLAPDRLGSALTPDTALEGVWRGSPRSLRQLIVKQTGWSVPAPPLSYIGCTVLMSFVVAAFLFGWFLSGWLIVPALAIGALVVRLDRGCWASHWLTVGALARSIAAANQKLLAGQGAYRSPVTIWQNLLTHLEPWSKGQSEISPDTRLLA